MRGSRALPPARMYVAATRSRLSAHNLERVFQVMHLLPLNHLTVSLSS
jgi:hypothetical protein